MPDLPPIRTEFLPPNCGTCTHWGNGDGLMGQCLLRFTDDSGIRWYRPTFANETCDMHEPKENP